MKRVLVVGAGGFAREVKWLISEIARHGGAKLAFAGYVVSDVSRLGEHDSREEVRGDLAWLRSSRGEWDLLAMGIGTPAARLKVAEELADFGDEVWPGLVHPRVIMDAESCRVGPGALVCAGTIATVNVVIERFALVNLACTLGHECRVGAGSVLNPTVNVSGGVQIGSGVLVGTGAQLLQYVNIGDGATVGAGSVVNKQVAPGVTVVGVPAKPLVKSGAP